MNDLDDQIRDFEEDERKRELAVHMGKWQAKLTRPKSYGVLRDELEGPTFLVALGVIVMLISGLVVTIPKRSSEGNALVGVSIILAAVVIVLASLYAYVSVMFWRDRYDELQS